MLLSLSLLFSLRGQMTERHTERLEVLSLYWHFVDAVWVVVFLVVYVFGR
jgi:cytochrome c oxidase subunit 3/cytochrome o ubiquinol oxidase subunit 3